MKEEDLEIKVFRNPGTGCNWVTGDEVYVQIEHIQTGLRTVCGSHRNERSQLENKRIALIGLQAMLDELE